MSWFCKHEWEIISTTYAPPSLRGMRNIPPEIALSVLHGMTTKLLRCPICKRIKKVEMLGKEES